MEACKQYYNTRYVRVPDLLMDLDIARTEGNYRKVMAKYSNPVLLILDEWMLLKPTDTEQKDIFELLHRRHKKSSTIFCSQYVFEEWYDQLGGEDSPLADAIIAVLLMTAIRSTSQALLMLSMTDPCVRFMAWIKHCVSKLIY